MQTYLCVEIFFAFSTGEILEETLTLENCATNARAETKRTKEANNFCDLCCWDHLVIIVVAVFLPNPTWSSCKTYHKQQLYSLKYTWLSYSQGSGQYDAWDVSWEIQVEEATVLWRPKISKQFREIFSFFFLKIFFTWNFPIPWPQPVVMKPGHCLS